MGISLIEKRGRPKGAKNGMRMVMPWRPLEWIPVYETMVAMSITGMSYKEIGAKLDYCPVQVGNIIRSPKAQEIAKSYIENVRSNTLNYEVNSLSKIKDKAIQRISDVILNEEFATQYPFRVAEFSASILKGLGTLSDASGPAAPTQNNIFIGTDIASKLFEGTMKADEAARLNGLTEIVIESK